MPVHMESGLFSLRENVPSMACKNMFETIRDSFSASKISMTVYRTFHFPSSFYGRCSFSFDKLMKLKFHLLNNSYLKLKLDFAYEAYALNTH